jgi:protein TonB
MRLNTDGQYRVQGWMVSALIHCFALTVGLGLMTQVKPVMPKELFKWDVALVEPQRIQESRQAETKPAPEPAKTTARPVAPSPIQPKIVTREAQPREVTPVRTEYPLEVEQTKQAVVESPAPVLQHEAVPSEPAIFTSDAPAIEVAPITRDLEPSTPPATAAVVDAKPAESVTQESSQQVAMATRPTPTVKVDHGWLAESLRRRLAELKRYPSTARLNGWEGKVVLRAVIRADGHLSEVKIHRSSGYEALDTAAMEAIRLVCPLHMHQPLGTSEVAVYVPMVYSLAS